jgi:hypothetical protein
MRGRSGGAPSLEPLDPMQASQPPAAIYSVRKVNPAYAGAAFQIRDSGNVLRTVNFGVDGLPDLAGAPGWGNGTFFTVAQWYDQSGNGRHLTSPNNVRPRLVLNAFTDAQGRSLPWVDYQAKNDHLCSSATFLNVGGTSNLAILAVAGTFGWSSAGTHARNPGVFGVNGPLIGYGTGANNVIVHGAYLSVGETVMYFKNGELFVERNGSIPDLSRFRNFWFNQKGAVVSGGADTRHLWSDRPHGNAEALAQRVTIGSNGALNQSHNGPAVELIFFNPVEPVTDLECQRMALAQRAVFGSLAPARYPDQFELIMAGQSLSLMLATVDSAASGVTADNVVTRKMTPDIKARLGIDDINSTLELYCLDTAYGGTSLLKKSDQTTGYWWDQDLDQPGDMALQWNTNALAQTRRAPKYKKTALYWDQGQADALVLNGGAGSGTYTIANYKACLIELFNYFRAQIGADVRIGIGPLGRQTGQDASMRALRKIQAEVAAEMVDVDLLADDFHYARQDSVHLAKSPPDTDGFGARGEQILRWYCSLWGDMVPWDAPYISSATLVSGTAIDVHVAWPNDGAGGNDISPAVGIEGFLVTGRALTGVVRLNASTIRLTGTGFVAGDLVQYDPQRDSVTRGNMVVDNTAGLPMPLRPAWDIAAAA